MKWFHKEDGGLIILNRHISPVYNHGYAIGQCLICQERWFFTGICEDTVVIKAPDKDFVHFSDLPEDLQAAALDEML